MFSVLKMVLKGLCRCRLTEMASYESRFRLNDAAFSLASPIGGLLVAIVRTRVYVMRVYVYFAKLAQRGGS